MLTKRFHAPRHFRPVKHPRLMSVIFLLIAVSTVVALFFLGAFVRAVKTGQFDDDRSPAVRMLNDHPPAPSTGAETNPSNP